MTTCNIGAQTFSYPTLGNNGVIYIAPFGLSNVTDYILKFNPVNNAMSKIQIKVNEFPEKWQKGITYRNYIYWLPYNEDNILILDTETDEVTYSPLDKKGKGMYIQGHINGRELIALPYGEHEVFDYVLHFDLNNHVANQIKLDLPFNDQKKWHTTQILDGEIYGLPRGENWETYFNYRIKYDCNSRKYELCNCVNHWLEYEEQSMTNKKFTTLAKVGNKLFAPPYSENPEFDVYMWFDGNRWYSEKTGIKGTSRKYYTHTVAKNGKIFCPPAGHDEDWDDMFVIDSNTCTWRLIKLGIGKESKKYFAGIENSKGKIYYIPRGGCVCEPQSTWKQFGDLAEILVVDTYTEKCYTIDISEFFYDNTTIEKYNSCVIKDDIIYALPYVESDSFQTVLVFDTIQEKVVNTFDLNDI